MEYYQLKKGIESFQVVDGPFENKKFFRGDLYRKEEIPPEEKEKFESVQDKKVGGVRLEAKKIKDLPQTSGEASLKPNAAEGERSKP